MMGLALLLVLSGVGFAEPEILRPSPSRIVAGAVLDATGQAVSGATVVWTLGQNRESTFYDLIRGTTDPEGRFRLESPAGYASSVWRSDVNKCWVAHPQHGLAVFNPSDAEIAPGEVPFYQCTLNLSEDPQRFRVIDTDSAPVAGELIEVSDIYNQEWGAPVPHPIREQLSSLTDEDGFVSLPLQWGDLSTLDLRVVSEAYGRQTFRQVTAMDEALNLQLAQTGRLKGRFERPDGGPIGEACIGLFPTSQMAKRLRQQRLGRGMVGHGTVVEEYLVTDQEGRFDFGLVPVGEYQLQAISRKSTEGEFGLLASIDVQANRESVASIVAMPAVNATGRVTVEGPGAVPTGTVVFLNPGGSNLWTSAVPDVTGRYRCRLPSGVVKGFVIPEDLATGSIQERARFEEEVVLKTDDVGRELPPLVIVQKSQQPGRIVDRDGRPVRRKRVIANEQGIVRSAARTDDDGWFWMDAKAFQPPHVFEVKIEGRFRSTSSLNQQPLEFRVD